MSSDGSIIIGEDGWFTVYNPKHTAHELPTGVGGDPRCYTPCDGGSILGDAVSGCDAAIKALGLILDQYPNRRVDICERETWEKGPIRLVGTTDVNSGDEGEKRMAQIEKGINLLLGHEPPVIICPGTN